MPSPPPPPPPPPQTRKISGPPLVTTQSGVHHQRSQVSRSATEEDEQRVLQRRLTADSAAKSAPIARPNPEAQYIQQSQQQSFGHGPSGGSFHPPSSYAVEGTYWSPHEELAYGHDHRSKPPKDKHTSGATSTFKKLGHALWSEAVNQQRPVATIETDFDRYKRERNELRAQCSDLQERHNYNVAIIKKLQEDLAQEKDRVDRTKRSVNLLEATMENKEIFLGAQARNDDEIRSRFGGLVSSIKTWSNNFNAGNGNAFKEDLLIEYQQVAPLCTKQLYLEDLVDDKKRKRLFVRGWTAYVMTKLLFRTLDPSGNHGTDIWMKKNLSENFAQLEDEFWVADRKIITHRAFNDWRAYTADLLSKTSTTHPQEAENEIRQAVLNAVHEVMALVRPWCVNEDHDTSYADRLQKIFIEAVQFAQYLRCQRALWTIRFPSRPLVPGLSEMGHLMFDPHSMRDDRGEDEDLDSDKLRQQYIDIVVTPAFYKRGNMNGERFENEETCLPAIVVIRRAEEK